MENNTENNNLSENENEQPEIAETHFYPPKPESVSEAHKITRSLISSVLFIGCAYFLLDWELLFIVKLIAVLLIHEMGHYAAMRHFDYQDLSIFFIPLVGAVATGDKEEISQKQSILVLMAGPVPGIILGAIIYAAGMYLHNEQLTGLGNIFLFLNAFNLLPFMPLDGGRILKTLFFEDSLIISTVFSVISAVGLAAMAFYLESYFLLIVPVFIILQLNSGYSLGKVKKRLDAKNISTDRSYSELSNQDYWQIRDEMGRSMSSVKRLIEPGTYMVSVSEEKIISLMKQLIRKKPDQDLSVVGKIGFLALWVGAFVIPIVGIAVVYLMTQ